MHSKKHPSTKPEPKFDHKPRKPPQYLGDARQRHPDAVKAAALAAYDSLGTRDTYALQRAAEITSIPYETIRSWLKRAGHNPDVVHLHAHQKLDLAQKLENIAHSFLDAMPEKLPTAPLNQVAVALGIAIDKRLLLLGQPNQIGISVHLTQEQRAKRLDDIFQRHLQEPQQVVVEKEGDESPKTGPVSGSE
jgi:hypothetical protein